MRRKGANMRIRARVAAALFVLAVLAVLAATAASAEAKAAPLDVTYYFLPG
jgi:succinate dehydrogenase hydrophobic anchor subunit